MTFKILIFLSLSILSLNNVFCGYPQHTTERPHVTFPPYQTVHTTTKEPLYCYSCNENQPSCSIPTLNLTRLNIEHYIPCNGRCFQYQNIWDDYKWYRGCSWDMDFTEYGFGMDHSKLPSTLDNKGNRFYLCNTNGCNIRDIPSIRPSTHYTTPSYHTAPTNPTYRPVYTQEKTRPTPVVDPVYTMPTYRPVYTPEYTRPTPVVDPVYTMPTQTPRPVYTWETTRHTPVYTFPTAMTLPTLPYTRPTPVVDPVYTRPTYRPVYTPEYTRPTPVVDPIYTMPTQTPRPVYTWETTIHTPVYTFPTAMTLPTLPYTRPTPVVDPVYTMPTYRPVYTPENTRPTPVVDPVYTMPTQTPRPVYTLPTFLYTRPTPVVDPVYTMPSYRPVYTPEYTRPTHVVDPVYTMPTYQPRPVYTPEYTRPTPVVDPVYTRPTYRPVYTPGYTGSTPVIDPVYTHPTHPPRPVYTHSTTVHPTYVTFPPYQPVHTTTNGPLYCYSCNSNQGACSPPNFDFARLRTEHYVPCNGRCFSYQNQWDNHNWYYGCSWDMDFTEYGFGMDHSKLPSTLDHRGNRFYLCDTNGCNIENNNMMNNNHNNNYNNMPMTIPPHIPPIYQKQEKPHHMEQKNDQIYCFACSENLPECSMSYFNKTRLLIEHYEPCNGQCVQYRNHNDNNKWYRRCSTGMDFGNGKTRQDPVLVTKDTIYYFCEKSGCNLGLRGKTYEESKSDAMMSNDQSQNKPQ